MGMDISSNRGFLLPFVDFLNLIGPAHLEGIRTAAIRLFRKKTEDCEHDAAFLEETIQAIQAANSVDAVRAALTKMVKPHKDYLSEDLREMELLRCVSKVILPVVPLMGQRFDNPRLNGYDVPIGELVLQFKFEDCFESRMNRSGEAMARTLGKDVIIPVEWTTMSV